MTKHERTDSYEVCPNYESAHFLLRLVSVQDAADLLECYKHPTASVTANAENCTYGYGMQTIEEMERAIDRWLEEYRKRWFIRFSIVDKESSKAVGTIEIMSGGVDGHSVLRIDLPSAYENEGALNELLAVSNAFFADLDCAKIVTKADPTAAERIHALEQNGYAPYPPTADWTREQYYIKHKNNGFL